VARERSVLLVRVIREEFTKEYRGVVIDDRDLHAQVRSYVESIAPELADRVASEGIRSLWASDLARASETARIVGARIGLEPRLEPRLREGNRGDWEGRLFEDVAREEPEAYAAWRRGGPDWRFPGGESLLEQQQRVAACIEELRAGAEPPVLAVAHGGSIRVMLCLSEPRGLAAFHDFEVPNVSVIRL